MRYSGQVSQVYSPTLRETYRVYARRPAGDAFAEKA
jgi:hypothetical protein